MKIVLLNVEQAQSIYSSQMVRDFPESELKPFASVQGMMTVLKELAAYYAPRKQSLIIECEHPAEAPEPAVARRRIGFYLRAGAHAAAMESRLFGVRYQIYSLPAGGLAKDEEIHRDLQELYRTMVPEPYYRGNVNFFGA